MIMIMMGTMMKMTMKRMMKMLAFTRIDSTGLSWVFSSYQKLVKSVMSIMINYGLGLERLSKK